MKENDQKKMLLSVLGVAILVVAVIGISFAAYTTLFKSNANTVSTGTIMVSYSESGQAINISNAMPLDDTNGKAQTDKFDFTVSTKADNALTVPYEVNLTKVTSSVEEGQPGYYASMDNNQIKVYLTKNGSAVTETGTDGVLVSALTASSLRSGSLKLHSASDVFSTTGEAAKTTNYTLRMWIDNNVNVDSVANKEFHAKVNVDSHVNPVGQS